MLKKILLTLSKTDEIQSKESLIERVNTIIKEKAPDYVSHSWDGDNLHVKASKMGTTTFDFLLKEDDFTFTLVEIKRSIAFMHKAFVGRIEGEVRKIVERNFKDALFS